MPAVHFREHPGEDLFGGWDSLGDSGPGDLVLWKTILFTTVIAVSLLHAFALGPRVRRLRQAGTTEALTEAQAASPRHLSIASSVSQVAMLATTLVILGRAADLAA